MLFEVLTDTLIDSLKLLPFLFVTYLLMEFLEHKASAKSVSMVKKSGKCGPLIGGLLGALPQCGFSAAGSNLYAGRIITRGTLISIYLSTSDEMLPILISEQANPILIFKILGIKIIIGLVAGFVIDIVSELLKKNKEDLRIDHMCEHEHCHCNEGNIFVSALIHTAQIILFIAVVSFVVNMLISVVGEESLSAFLKGKDVLSVFLSGIVGLIPNCAASVVITELYLEGFLNFSAMMSGLLVGAGVGLLVLFRANDNLKDSIRITGLLYLIGVVAGIIMLLIGF